MTTPTRKHRAPDRIAVLEQQVADLEDAAGRMVESILRGIQDATELDAARKELAANLRHISRLEAEAAGLRAERVDASVLRKQLAAAEEHILRISAENVALKADIANRDAITVPPMHRDVDPDDQATTPVDVRSFRQHHVVTLPQGLGGAA